MKKTSNDINPASLLGNSNMVQSIKDYNSYIGTAGPVLTSPYSLNTGLERNPSPEVVAFPPNIPIIYSIKSVNKYLNKVCITYEKTEDTIFPESNEGSIYTDIDVVAIFSNKGNHYWNNKLIVECENEENINKLLNSSKFVILNQWKNKLGNDDLVKSIRDPYYYYDLVHSIIEESSSLYKISEHQKVDKVLNLKDYD